MVDRKNSKCLEEKIDSNKTYGIGIRHVQMCCMSVCMLALFMARASMGVAVLAMSDDKRKNDTNITIYDWDKKTQSVILSSFFWGYASMQIPAGMLAKRFGGKPILLFALLSNSVICLLIPIFASVGGWPLVCAGRVMMGLTQACTFPATHTLLGQWLPPSELSSYTGIVYAGTQLGTILSIPISGFLAETTLGWKMIFYAMACILLVVGGIFYWFSASSPKFHRMISEEERLFIEIGLKTRGLQNSNRTPWKAILTSVPMWALLAPHVGFAMSFVLFFVDMPTYLEKGLGISLKNSASLSALPYIGMWVGSIFSSILSGKIINGGLISVTASRKLFTSLSLFGVAGGTIVLSFLGPNDRTLAIVTLITTLFLSGFNSVGYIVNQLDLSPNYAGIIMSLVNFVANIGSVMVPLLTGLILGNDPTDVSRWHIVFLIYTAICFITNIIYLIFASTERQPWDDPDFLDKNNSNIEEVKPVLNSNEKEKEANKQSS